MNGERLMSLKRAKQSFTEMMESLSKTDQQKLLVFISTEWKFETLNTFNDSRNNMLCDSNEADNSTFILNSIVSDIKQKIPFDAILSSETITTPLLGENSDCHPNVTLHVDEFLYNDEDMDELVDNGQLQRHYCVDCGSKNIQPLIFISHSMSQDMLYFIFNTFLPTLKDKVVLDIGSRLGAVLYGAYIYTDANRIIGVEMNKDFCNLQNDIIQKYKMNDRITILHNKIEEVPEIIKESDIIIINNAFEFYLCDAVQIEIWKFLKKTIKQGTIIVTRPSIETTFKNLQIEISIENWLKPFTKSHSDKFSTLFILNDEKDRYSGIQFYEVL